VVMLLFYKRMTRQSSPCVAPRRAPGLTGIPFGLSKRPNSLAGSGTRVSSLRDPINHTNLIRSSERAEPLGEAGR
jgi:hypothetical protein